MIAIGSDERGEVMNRFQITSHLFKWAVETKAIDGNRIPFKVGVGQRDHYVAALYHRSHTDRVLIGQEAIAYFARKAEERKAEHVLMMTTFPDEPVKVMREPGEEG
mgnify:CR=1 FL=1